MSYNAQQLVRSRQFGNLTFAKQFDELVFICVRVSLLK